MVDDDAIAEAMVLMVERGKLVSEGAGAASVAALLSGAVAPAASGDHRRRPLRRQRRRPRAGRGDQPPPDQRRPPHPPLHRRRRPPAGLADLLQAVADAGGNVLDVMHVRDGVALNVDETGVELVIETRSQDHRLELVERIRAAGYTLTEMT